MFNFGFIGGGSLYYTNCWTPLANSGTIYGFDTGTALGSISPSVTSDGSTIYAYNFDTSTGVFRLEIGATGVDQLTNTNMIIHDHPYGNVELFWDAVEFAYLGTDQALATALAADVGSNTCFATYVIPELLIHYTYTELIDG